MGKGLSFLACFGLLVAGTVAVADETSNSVSASTEICSVAVSGSGVKTYRAAAPSKNDNAEIQCAIDRAVHDLQTGDAQSATILLQPNARYNLTPIPHYYSALSIKTSDLTKQTFANLTFNGQGATLVLAPTTAGIYVNGCESCLLENFTIRTDPSPMVEGKLVSATPSSLDVRVTRGAVFTAPEGYRSIVGKNARVAILHAADEDAFPSRYRFPARAPVVLMLSASNPLPNIVRILYERSLLPPSLPTTTVVSLINPPLSPTKQAAMTQVLSAAAIIRKRYPQFGPQFFTGGTVAALFLEQNKGIAVRHVRISDYPGQAIHAGFNRGELAFDDISITPGSSGGFRSVGAAGIAALNNQTGPRIMNSLIQNVGDDAIALGNLPFFALRATGSIVDLSAPRSLIQSISVTPGDRFYVIDAANGRNFGIFRAITASPFFISERNYGYRVEFDKELPPAISLQDADPAVFINLDQANSGAVIRDNLIIGGERNGLMVSSSATVEHNIFISLGLWAIQYIPFIIRTNKLASGLWSDFGPVTIRNNAVIDVPLGLLRLSGTGASQNYGVELKGLTVSNNIVIAASNSYVPFYAAHLDNASSMPIGANKNTLIVPDVVKRDSGVQFVTGKGNPDAWRNAFPIVVKKSRSELWDLKCQTISASLVWKSLLQTAAPGACP